MPDPSIEELRGRLKELGYLTHGLERWFALDPWSSRTFWQELFAVAAKAATLVALFVAMPMIAAMQLRNGMLPLREAAAFSLAYLVFGFAAALVLVLLAALALKIRAAAAIEHPLILTLSSLLLAAVVAGGTGVWWIGFDGRPREIEVIAIPLLILLQIVVSAIVFSAALLSFSIHETRRIPAVARRSRSWPILIAGAILLGAIVGASRGASPGTRAEAPRQIAIVPSSARLALIAVDGLSGDLFTARPGLAEAFQVILPMDVPPASSAAEIWATIGTGTPPVLHGVHAVEGLRIAGGRRVVQAVSRFDPLRADLAERAGLVRKQPLPNTTRQRDYAWEILAARGVPAGSVNWWISSPAAARGIWSVGQDEVFSATAGLPPAERALAIDAHASEAVLRAVDSAALRFVTLYLPGLDIALHRLDLSDARRLAVSVAAIDRLAALVETLTSRGYQVLLAASPGEGGGRGVLASTIPLEGTARPESIAPTILHRFGFPSSDEMPGESLLPGSKPERIPTVGSRRERERPSSEIDQEYYEALRSLGYVR